MHVPGRGYVAIGEVIGLAQRFDEARVSVDGVDVPLAAQSLVGQLRARQGRAAGI
ncbi:MAG: hypothetical protein V9F04_07295 [Dermatophilaceae bacterium]